MYKFQCPESISEVSLILKSFYTVFNSYLLYGVQSVDAMVNLFVVEPPEEQEISILFSHVFNERSGFPILNNSKGKINPRTYVQGVKAICEYFYNIELDNILNVEVGLIDIDKINKNIQQIENWKENKELEGDRLLSLAIERSLRDA